MICKRTAFKLLVSVKDECRTVLNIQLANVSFC